MSESPNNELKCRNMGDSLEVAEDVVRFITKVNSVTFK